jgi:hypothetical protein
MPAGLNVEQATTSGFEAGERFGQVCGAYLDVLGPGGFGVEGDGVEGGHRPPPRQSFPRQVRVFRSKTMAFLPRSNWNSWC